MVLHNFDKSGSFCREFEILRLSALPEREKRRVLRECRKNSTGGSSDISGGGEQSVVYTGDSWKSHFLAWKSYYARCTFL